MRITLTICLTSLMMAAGTLLNAQDSDTTLARKYERETIILDYTNNGFVKNKESKRTGFFSKKLEKEFEGVSAEAQTELKDHQRKKKLGVGLLIGGGTLMLGGLAVAPVIVLPAAAVIFFTGTGTYLGGGILLNKSHRHLQKAVWLRNRDILVKK